MKSARRKFSRRTARKGFALLVTITLLALLVLVLVSLATLTRVETQVATNSQQLTLARQNALLGLNVALGRLQSLAGPDQRVTATADIVAGRDSTKMRWSGVWNADTSHSDYGDNIGWLVSGPVTPGDASSTEPLAATADNPLVTLVGQNTAGSEDSTSVIHVNAEPIKSAAVPGMNGDQTIGHFAYWIGDEGMKAKVTLSDPWVGSMSTAERRYSFINMQRSGVELINASNSTRVETAYTANDPSLNRMLSLAQLPLIGPTADTRLSNAVRNRFHDLTATSTSVLTDVARGGLKKDLTNWINFSAPSGAAEQDDKPIIIINDPGEDLVGIPRWGLLRSYATTRDSGTALPPQEQTRTQHGLTPVVTYFRFGVNVSANADQPLKMHVFPTVVLWNPHSVPLSHEDASGNPVVYQLAWKTDVARALRFVPANDPTPVNSSTRRSTLSMGTFNVFDIELTEPIPPGRSLVFTLKPPGGGGDTVPYDPNGGTVLIHKAEDGTSAVLEGLSYTDAELTDGIDCNINSTGGSTMRFLLRRKPTGTIPPLGTGQVDGEYQAVEGIGFSGFTASEFNITKDDLLIAIEPRFAMDMYPHMSGTLFGPSFRWIANQNYRARYYPRPNMDGSSPVVMTSYHFSPISSKAIQPLNFDEGGARANAGTTVTLGTGETARDLVLDEVLPVDAVLTSLAQFQHANLSLVSHYPTYAVGNSLASPYIALSATEEPNITKAGLHTEFYDISYLLNRQLWDRYYLSTIPPALSAAALADTGYRLPNARLRILRDDGVPPLAAVAGATAFDTAAAHLMVDGGFNVNSTSPQAWRAFLAGHLGVETVGTNRHPFSRSIRPFGTTNKSWEGYRNLSDKQIDRLAWNIVNEVRTRGPFLSLADFVNRRLVARGSDPDDTQRYKGALQAAIDRSDTEAEPPADEPPAAPINFDVEDGATAIKTFQNPLVRNKPTDATWRLEAFQGGPIKQAPYSSRSAFAPGYLTQADLLTAIGPALTVRSDTFTIRSYGDVRNPVTEQLESRAWCEAVVQRLPEPMHRKNPDPSHPDYHEPAPATPMSPDFGRRLKIVSFRWLSPEEI